MGGWKEMWKEWDALKAKSKGEYERADEEIKKLPGWKFKGCPDGVVWRATNQKESLEATDRTADGLVTKVKAEAVRIEERDRKQAEEDAQAKARGAR